MNYNDMFYNHGSMAWRYLGNNSCRDKMAMDTKSSRANRQYQNFKVLLVNSFHPKASDDAIRAKLYHEFRRFGDVSVRVQLEPEGRVAYARFSSSSEANEALSAKIGVEFFNRPAMIQALMQPEKYYPNSSPYPIPSPTFSSSSSFVQYGRPSFKMMPTLSHRELASKKYGPGPVSRSSWLPDYSGRGRDRGHHEASSYHGFYRDRSSFENYHPRYFDSMKSSYPIGQHYNQPAAAEDEAMASRSLFVGNLDPTLDASNLRAIFGRFGKLLDVQMKSSKSKNSSSSSFALLQYSTIDMATTAKREVAGQFLGRLPVKIGFGKTPVSRKICVVGLGEWCSFDRLWHEFDRFGCIMCCNYEFGSSTAEIFFHTKDAAEAAVQAMKGFPLGGPEFRIGVDFCAFEEKSFGTLDTGMDEIRFLSQAITLVPPHWNGLFELKESLFAVQLHILNDSTNFESFKQLSMVREKCLVMRQRMKMNDKEKLEEIESTDDLSFVALPRAVNSNSVSERYQQHLQPLEEFINYLNSKQSFGVIGLTPADDDGHQTVMYLFPPSEFAESHIRGSLENIEISEDDAYLLIIVSGLSDSPSKD